MTPRQWTPKASGLPGSYFALNQDKLYPADNQWGIPALRPFHLDSLPGYLIPYRTRVRCQDRLDDGAVHFFVNDFRFETAWSRPGKALQALRPFRIVLAPDFSLYADWPVAMQLWNVYRARWCGRFWQEQGFTVIPTVSWSTANSFAYCFLGIPQRTVVAVSAVGLRWHENLAGEQLFLAGFREMVTQLQPVTVLAYGPLPSSCYDLVPVVEYPTRWQNIRRARREAYRAMSQEAGD